VRRVRLRLVRGVEVEFVDREVALRQFAEIAERGRVFRSWCMALRAVVRRPSLGRLWRC